MPQTAQGNAPWVHVEDGVSEMMECIVVSAKPQAPFTLTLETEWVRMLGDGGTITSVNKRRIARDAAGRVYQERWFLAPKNGNVESQMTTVHIADPSAHTLYNCFFVGAKKNICELKTYIPMTPAVNTTGKTVSGDLPENQGSFVHEDLGKQLVSGVETIRVRDARTYLNLLSTRTDPRTGKQTFTATNVTLGDPDPALFELRTGFKVTDIRQTAVPEPN